MSPETLDLDHLLKVLISISKEAGREIIRIKQNHREKPRYSRKKLLTEGDLAANRIWLTKLAQLSYKIPVISEESSLNIGNSDYNGYLIIIDPLDGSRDYVSSDRGYVSQAALLYNGSPILSVIYHPESRTIYYSDGKDAYKGGSCPTRTLKVNNRSRGLRAIASRNIKARDRRMIMSLSPIEIISMGSVGYKAAKIAEGKAEYCVYGPHSDLGVWDIMPAVPFIKAAGGKMTDWDNNEFVFERDYSYRNGILIDNGVIHEDCLKILRP